MDELEKKLNEISERINRAPLNEEKQNSYTETLFESIKHINEYGNEFWYARELQKALEYNQWRRFEEVIERAKNACKNSGNIISEHFANVGKSSPMPNGGERIIDDYALSRYACYLIVQNGDSRKKVIALGQTYFAVKTRQQELIENFDDLSEDKKQKIRRITSPLPRLQKWLEYLNHVITLYFKTKGTKDFMEDLVEKKFMQEKDLKRAKTFWIIWEVQNLLQIFFAQHKPMRNYGKKT